MAEAPPPLATWTRTTSLLALVALLVGGALGAARAGVALDPYDTAWIMAQGFDMPSDWLAIEAFARSPWASPPGYFEAWNWPVGSTIGLSDGYPAFAFLSKLARPLSPRMAQWFGWIWVLHHALQAGFGFLLARRLTQDDRSALLGAALFLLTPSMLLRSTMHVALSAHWTILAGLWLFFASQTWRVPHRIGAWSALLVVSSLTHPTLATMTAAILLARLAHAVLTRDVRDVAGWAVTSLTALTGLAAGWWASGIFFFERAGLSARGSGLFAIDAAAWIEGAGHSRLGFDLGLAQSATIESFAYLGVGVMILLIAALYVSRGREDFDKRTQIVLGAAALGAWCFALGTTPRALGSSLGSFDPGLLEGLYGAFRACGRFAWLTGYVMMCGALATLTSLSARARLVLLSVCVIAQLVDVRLWHDPLVNDASARALDDARWAEPLANAQVLVTIPPYPESRLGTAARDWELIRVALEHDLVGVTAGKITRAPDATLQVESRRRVEDLRSPSPTHVWVGSPAGWARFGESLDDVLRCAELDALIVCRAEEVAPSGWTSLSARVIAAQTTTLAPADTDFIITLTRSPPELIVTRKGEVVWSARGEEACKGRTWLEGDELDGEELWASLELSACADAIQMRVDGWSWALDAPSQTWVIDEYMMVRHVEARGRQLRAH